MQMALENIVVPLADKQLTGTVIRRRKEIGFRSEKTASIAARFSTRISERATIALTLANSVTTGTD